MISSRSFLYMVALFSLAISSTGAQDNPRPRGLKPLIEEDLEDAIKRATRRRQAIIVAVGMTDDGGHPAIFSERTIARASRSTLVLIAMEYTSEDDFYRLRGIKASQVPCFLILDSYGNLVSRVASWTPPRTLVNNARSVRTLMRNIQQDLPKTLKQAQDAAQARDEDQLIALARPWLARHLTGYPEIAELRKLLVTAAKGRVEALAARKVEEAIPLLLALAKRFAHTPVQAEALLAAARLHEEKKKDRAKSKALLKKIIVGLPWPENKRSHQLAKRILREYRREEIKKRLEEMKKKDEKKQP